MLASSLINNSHKILIENSKNELLKNIQVNIKSSNMNSINKLSYELPYHFESFIEIYEKNIMSMEDVRYVIWGHVVEKLTAAGFIINVEIDDNNEKAYLHVKWGNVNDIYKDEINKYKNIIKSKTNNHF